ncbi:MAG: two-component system response regulator HydG [Desulforhopalus sp.]|jgi:two-component system response regulator HydG
MSELKQKPVIVVVDDEESIRYSFETFLEDGGYEVACAADLETGLELIQSLRPDIIFSDIILGNDDGLQVVKKVGELKLNSPVIVITGQPSIDTASEAVRLGAYDYMVKPIVKESLLRVTRIALKNKLLIDEKESINAEKDHYRKHLEAIFSNVDDPILSIDNSWKIIACNDAAYTLYGYSTTMQDGSTLGSNIPGRFPLKGTMVKGSNNPFLRACVESIGKSLALKESVKNVKKTFTTAGGQQCLISINCAPLLGKDQQSLGAALVVKDLTRMHQLEKRLKETTEFRRTIGNCYKMDKVFELVRALAETDATVLITGESGTGKSLVAKEIHELSERSPQNMVTVRCSALAEQLLESELFGHVKGAFTGAINNKVGRFELCNKGSIFLDEIGEISPGLQLKLLSVIQEREFERVGDHRTITIDTRIIAATNRHLKEEVDQGNFREDLYYRLNVVEIKMPPLRERFGDIPLLVDHFINKFKKKYNKNIYSTSEDVMEVFNTYTWPGNVRELEHAIEHSFVLCREEVIDLGHIPPAIRQFHNDQKGDSSEIPKTESEEKAELIHALEKTDWNKAKTARLLGVSRPTLYRKLVNFGLDQQ